MSVLAAFLPVDRRHALATGMPLPDRVQGAALFADISGFTQLTKALAVELGRQRGAEVVLDMLNPIYDALIGALHEYGGSVIGFAGDSITCWLDQDDGWLAVQCALAMQEVLRRQGFVSTPAGTPVQLSIKIGIATGPARRFLVGDPAIHLFEALAGKTLQHMAEAESHAHQGEVLLSRAAAAALAERIVVSAWRPENDAQAGAFACLAGLSAAGLAAASRKPWPELPPAVLPAQQLRAWIDAPVYARLQAGDSYLAELRPVTSLFLRFSGIDYDDDDRAGEQLDAFVRWVQAALARYEGTMTQLTIGDKGSNLLAAFGAPLAHDDDMERAAAAALALCAPPAKMPFIHSLQLGISAGLAWAGAVGGRRRCIYSVMGDEVNMAARLMGRAAAGQILVNQPFADATARRFQYRALGEIQVKGRQQPLLVSELLGRPAGAGQALSALFANPLVGREAVLAVLLNRLEQAGQGQGQVLRLEGPAGVGKSHLAAVFIAQAVAQGWQTAVGLCQSTLQDSPYAPWRQAFLAWLEIGPGSPTAQSAQVEALLRQTNPDWAPRLPLLADILGLPFTETPLTAGLEARQRREALLALVSEIIQARTVHQPLLLVLEDIHWLDEASAQLALAVAGAIANCPAVLLLVQRPPLEAQSILPELHALPYHELLQLGDLALDAVAALAGNRLGAPLSRLGLELVWAWAQGNPFFSEEVLDTLGEAGYIQLQADEWQLSALAFDALIDGRCLVKIEGEWQFVEQPPLGNTRLNIPATVQGAVLARLDRLPEAHKLALKVASVIGRTFAQRLLQALVPISLAEMDAALQTARQRDFVRLERPGEEALYIFKHNTTQEVVYSTLLFAQRQALHARVGEWYEQQYNDRPLAELSLDAPLSIHYPLLAHHWRQAERPDRERIYARLAGEQAAYKFANESAGRYYDRALELTPPTALTSRWNLLLARENVHDVMGHRQQQQQGLAALDDLAAEITDERQLCLLELRRVRYANATGDAPAAFAAVDAAVRRATALRDGNLEAEALHLWGRLLWQTGDYDAALERLEQSLAKAWQAENRLQAGRCCFDIGMVYGERLDYAAALHWYNQAADLYQAVNYAYGEIGVLLNMGALDYELGRYLDASGRYEQARRLSRAIGWRYAESFSISNLGNNAFDLGDYLQAESLHQQALALTRAIGARYREAVSLDTLSLIRTFTGDAAAAQIYARQALAIQQDLGDRRGQGYTLNHLGLALAIAGESAAARQAFEQALSIRRELEQHALALDDLAGLARLALAAGEVDLRHVEEILTSIAGHGLEGCEFPLWVYLTCFRALEAAGEAARARATLTAGVRLLQQRSAAIQDGSQRRRFLQQVSFNRELLDAWDGDFMAGA